MAEKKLDIKIQAHVEVGEMRKVEEALQREIVQMRLAGAAADQLAAKEKQLGEHRQKLASIDPGKKWAAAFGGIAESIPGLSSFYAAFNGSLTRIAAGALVAKKAFDIGRDSIRAFAASEVEMAKLDAALANSGKLTDAYREKLSRLATARSGKTGIDDEKYIGVFTTLTKFGADTGNIDRYTTAVENLAGFMGGDLEQAAFLFGKAMQGSTEMLGRYGIQVDKTKSDTEQLEDIMRQLAARGGGQLEAMGNTLDGSFSKAKNAWENMLESLGSAAEKSGLAQIIADWAENVQMIADRIGGGSGSKSKNRENFVAGNPAQQQAADDLSASNSSLEAARLELQKNRIRDKDALGLARMNPLNYLPGSTRIKDLEASIAASMESQAAIFAAIEHNGATAAAKGFDRGSPDQAAAMREIAALRKGTVEFSPGGSPEEIAQAKAYYEKVRLKKEEQALDRAALQTQLKLAAAMADGNKAEEVRLRWAMDYNKARREGLAAGMDEKSAVQFATDSANSGGAGRGYKTAFEHTPAIADRLSQIGGYNANNPVAAAQVMTKIERATERTATAVEKIAGKPDPKTPEVNTF